MRIVSFLKKSIVSIIVITSAVMLITVTNSGATGYDSNWFNALQESITAIKAGEKKPGIPTLQEVVALAVDSGAQMYVIIQTAMAMDSDIASEIIKATIEVSRNPDQVVKSAIIANISLSTIVKSSLEAGVTPQEVVLSAIDAGADLESLIRECIRAGADPEQTITAAIRATRNVGAVVSAAVNAGASEKNIARAVFGNRNLVDETQAVTSCISAGINLNTIIKEALDAGLNPGLVTVVSLYTSNDYQQVVNSAITWGLTKSEIEAYTKNNLSIDHEALARALAASEVITAYTPSERRLPHKNSIGTDPGRGNVSPN